MWFTVAIVLSLAFGGLVLFEVCGIVGVMPFGESSIGSNGTVTHSANATRWTLHNTMNSLMPSGYLLLIMGIAVLLLLGLVFACMHTLDFQKVN